MKLIFCFNDETVLHIDNVISYRDCGRDYEVRYNVPERDNIPRIRYISKVGTEWLSGHVVEPAITKIIVTGVKHEIDKLIVVNGKNNIV